MYSYPKGFSVSETGNRRFQRGLTRRRKRCKILSQIKVSSVIEPIHRTLIWRVSHHAEHVGRWGHARTSNAFQDLLVRQPCQPWSRVFLSQVLVNVKQLIRSRHRWMTWQARMQSLQSDNDQHTMLRSALRALRYCNLSPEHVAVKITRNRILCGDALKTRRYRCVVHATSPSALSCLLDGKLYKHRSMQTIK